MNRTPTMKNASLAGIAGNGVITLLRDAQNDVVEANGTFRPEGERLDLDELYQAFQTGRKVVYEGSISDGQGQGDRDERSSLEVSITRINDYTTLDGNRELLVNFLGSERRHRAR